SMDQHQWAEGCYKEQEPAFGRRPKHGLEGGFDEDTNKRRKGDHPVLQHSLDEGCSDVEPGYDAGDPSFGTVDSEERADELAVLDPAILEPRDTDHEETAMAETITGRILETNDFANDAGSHEAVLDSESSPTPNCHAEGYDERRTATVDKVVYDGGPLSPAEELYGFDNGGAEHLNAWPLKHGRPWNSLPAVRSAMHGPLILHVGDSVFVRCTDSADHLAKIIEMRDLEDGRYVVVFAWYYTRADIKRELKPKRRRSKQLCNSLDRYWPPNAPYEYMLSTDRIITLWDTAQRKAPSDVLNAICADAFYIITGSKREFAEEDTKEIRPALLASFELPGPDGPGSHSGSEQWKLLQPIPEDYGILHKIGYVTGDNHGASDVLCRALSESLREEGITWQAKHHRIRCHGHVINLAVQAFLFMDSKEAVEAACKQSGTPYSPASTAESSATTRHRRTDSLRTLRSSQSVTAGEATGAQQENNPLIAAGPSGIDSLTAPFFPRSEGAAAPVRPVAFLNLDLIILKSNQAFRDVLVHGREVVGQDLVMMLDHGYANDIQRLRRGLREEKEDRDPTYMPPINSGGQNEQETQRQAVQHVTDLDFEEYCQDYIARRQSLRFRLPNGQLVALNVSFRLARASLFFVTLALPPVERRNAPAPPPLVQPGSRPLLPAPTASGSMSAGEPTRFFSSRPSWAGSVPSPPLFSRDVPAAPVLPAAPQTTPFMPLGSRGSEQGYLRSYQSSPVGFTPQPAYGSTSGPPSGDFRGPKSGNIVTRSISTRVPRSLPAFAISGPFGKSVPSIES
ncbi:hypothetical protein H2201_009141, partial [Coniosporium apollinis]